MAEDLPDPPSAADIARIPPVIHPVPAGAEIGRLWYSRVPQRPTGFALFRRFGPTASRFDHHPEDDPCGNAGEHEDHAILYAMPHGSTTLVAALGEFFQDTRLIDRSTQVPTYSTFAPTRDLSLLDITGFFATRLGASSAPFSGPRKIARRWSRAFHAAYPDIDGLRYRSSMSGGEHFAYALYERCEACMPPKERSSIKLDDPELDQTLNDCAKTLGFGLEQE